MGLLNSLYPLPRKPVAAPGPSGFGSPSVSTASQAPATPQAQRHQMLADGTYQGSTLQQSNASDNAAANANGPGIGASSIVPTATQAATPPPRPLTQYQTLLQKRLSGQDPTVLNAQQQQNTNASLNNYTALRTAQQTGTQGGLQQGGLQYQRGVDKAQGAAAEQNLSGQDRVNALARSQGQDTMQMAHSADLEQDKKNNDFINSLPPKAQQHLRQILAQGGDVQEEYAKMIGPDGTLTENYRDATPGATALQGTIDELTQLYPEKSPEEIRQMAITEGRNRHGTQTNPYTDETRKETIRKLNNATSVDWTTPENKDALDNLTDTKLGQFNNDNRAEDSWATANAGQWVKINGQPYKVVGPNTDWQVDDKGNRVKGVNVTDASGKTITLGQDGKPTKGKYGSNYSAAAYSA